MPIKKKTGEKKNDFISRCIGTEVSAGKDVKQASAICYTYWEELSLAEIKKKRKYQKLETTKMVETFKSVQGEDYTQFNLTIDDLLNPKNQAGIVAEDELTQKFETIPDGFLVRYKYISDVAGHRAERPFCQMMTVDNQNTWWSRKDIETLNNAPGKANRKGGKPYSVFNWRGGNYCKHIWVRYFYNPDTGQFLDTPVQPLQKSTIPQ